MRSAHPVRGVLVAPYVMSLPGIVCHTLCQYWSSCATSYVSTGRSLHSVGADATTCCHATTPLCRAGLQNRWENDALDECQSSHTTCTVRREAGPGRAKTLRLPPAAGLQVL